jgi:hypothetical protein
MKRLALIIIVAAAIVLAFIFLKPSPIAGTSNQTISNFSFAESSAGPKSCNVTVANKIIFEGNLTKPTPCNGLTANYSVNGNVIKVNITTTPYEGMCIAVISDTFYKGSFEVLPAEDFTLQIYYAGAKICDKTLSVTGSAKEQSCINSGGTVTTGMCCGSVNDFPGTCVIGACGCSLENSHSVKLCDCGEGSCFNGNNCTEPCIGSGCPTY